ncbi:MAG: MFS transporter, partial [Candidatus Dormibacteraeota bacterium]|nr:MFS transporter [Candidatus Dormibacteraeota bacterium]
AGLLAIAPSYPMAVAVAFALAIGTAVFSPSSSALVPRLVPGDLLVAANGLLWTAGVALQLVAAPVAGLLVANGFARLLFALNAGSFVASALVLLRLPALAGPVSLPERPRQRLPEAFRLLRNIAVLPTLLVMQLLAALSVGATSALLVVLAEKEYHLSPTGYGFWLAAIAVGALLGPLLLPLLTRIAPERVVPAAYAIRGCGDAGLGLLSQGATGGALLALYGINTSSGMVSFQTLIQRRVPEAVRGRTFALVDLTWQAGRLVSVAVGAALAGLVGIRPVFVAGGILLVAAAAVGVTRLRPDNPGVKQADSP